MKADEKEAASPDEISQAMAGLTAADLRKLQKFARFRMAALGACHGDGTMRISWKKQWRRLLTDAAHGVRAA